MRRAVACPDGLRYTAAATEPARYARVPFTVPRACRPRQTRSRRQAGDPFPNTIAQAGDR